MKLTTIVIDDSSLQQMATCRFIKDHPHLELIGAYHDPEIGLEAVNDFQPDVLFLDVEMPGINGFEVIEQLDCNCQVILNSTLSDFALSAFQYDEVKDYLMKPMNRSRFKKAIDKAVKNHASSNAELGIANIPVYTERLSRAS